MSQVIFNRKILKRFLNTEELVAFEKEYNKNKKKGWGTGFPTQEDWEFFHKNSKPSFDFWLRRWKLTVTAVHARLGKMYLMDK